MENNLLESSSTNGIATLSLPLKLRTHCETVRDRSWRGEDWRRTFRTRENQPLNSWNHRSCSYLLKTDLKMTKPINIIVWSGWPGTLEYMGIWAFDLLHWMPWYNLRILAMQIEVDEILISKRGQIVGVGRWVYKSRMS